MKNDNSEKLVPISEAVKILGVSIDTVRRWDKDGTLHSVRREGNTRYFSLEELENIKLSKPLSISEVAQKLDISPSTLIRLERKGLIKPGRNKKGERTYDSEILENFLNSEYFLRQKQVQEKVLEPLKAEEKTEEEKASLPEKEEKIEENQKVIGTITNVNREEIGKIKRTSKAFYVSLLGIGLAFAAIIILITVLFLLFPEDTARKLGYLKTTVDLKKSGVNILSQNAV
ncbi:MAG: MerR family transcriptional regulator, partial [Candidatus Levybacteria bacterium]|nr:MerR family transcriptional regulator [Candidatus Levybacteria bacterium]